jgi:hypothetical protein
MGDKRRAHCRECGGHRDDVGTISWSGLCLTCGHRLHAQSLDELKAHDGVIYRHWRGRLAASMQRLLLDAREGGP